MSTHFYESLAELTRLIAQQEAEKIAANDNCENSVSDTEEKNEEDKK